MSQPAEPPPLPVCRRFWLNIAGWLWIAILAFCFAFLRCSIIPEDALDVGVNAFKFAMLIGLPLALAALVTSVCLLAIGILRIIGQRRDKWVPWIQIGTLLVLFVGVANWPIAANDRPNPVSAESESEYLVLAAVARDHLSGSDFGDWLSLDPSSREYSESKIPVAARQQLERMVPAYWPRYLLHIWIDGDCVVLSRGTGMLGEVGVRIYDHGPVVLYSPEELRKNPYLPRQERITDRLWFFRSG